MRRPVCTLLASFVLFTSLLKAQQNESQSSESGVLSTSDADTTIIRLLQESHDLGQQLPVPIRLMNLLPRQADLVSQLRPDLGREWASELFTFSSQSKGPQRTSTQNAAIGLLIRLDSGRALELLQSLNIGEPVPKWAASPPEMALVHRLFEVLIQRDGVSALPVLQQEADRLGKQGFYPYAALGYAAMQATLNDWGKDNQHAIRVLESVLEPAFARYSQNAHQYSDDFEFGKMLEVLAGGLPFDSVQPALRALVKNLLAADTSRYQFELEGYTSDGRVVKAHNTIDATILFLGSLINRDAELAKQLEATRPELQGTLEFSKAARLHPIRFHHRWSSSTSEQQQTHMDAVSLSHVNPEAAIAMAEQLPDGDRASTALDVARNIAGDYPERAAELIAEAQSTNRPVDDEMNVNLFSARAFVAVAQNKNDELHDLLQRAFASANRVVLEQQRTGDIHFFKGIGPLVQVGVQNDPDLTIAFIESLPSSYLKAELLLGAASNLYRPVRVPLRSRPQEKVEKPAQ
ncbi:MAG: hypothetical protein DMG38_22945 [Acidobacteria bacterium]|nr:MAG: hypothetical protein DMG38_22945 [Acidobacteriota bacterium]